MTEDGRNRGGKTLEIHTEKDGAMRESRLEQEERDRTKDENYTAWGVRKDGRLGQQKSQAEIGKRKNFQEKTTMAGTQQLNL